MSSFSRRLRVPAPDEYLSLKPSIDAMEASAMLGMSYARFRQLAGTRDTPNLALGAPVHDKGVRGARWTLRQILDFGISEHRSIQVPIPPLLPFIEGRPRYLPTGEPGRVVTVLDSTSHVQAWVQIFEHTLDRDSTEEKASDLVLVTPLWPASVQLLPTLPMLVNQFLNDIGRLKEYENSTDTHLTAVILPAPEDRKLLPGVRWSTLTKRELSKNGGRADRWKQPNQLAPFEDVARCLGWKSIPVWPEGTASASTVATWSDGTPVPVSVPASWQVLWSASQLARKAKTAPRLDPEISESFDALERTIVNTMSDSYQSLPELPAWTSYAASLKIERIPDLAAQRTVSTFPAIDRLITDPNIPAPIGDALINYFGDWQYSAPCTLNLRKIPPAWQDAFLSLRKNSAAIAQVDQGSARIRRLVRFAMATETTAVPILQIHGRTILAWTNNHVTWLAWNGYYSELADDPASAWSEEATEVLVTRDNSNRSVGVWTTTPLGSLNPLPISQGQYSFPDLARRALKLDHHQASPSLERFLKSVSPMQSQTLTVPDLIGMIRQEGP